MATTRQRNRDKAGEMQRAMSRRHHLRRQPARAARRRGRRAPGAAAARCRSSPAASSHSATPRMMAMPNSAARIPSSAATARSRPRMSPTGPTPTPSVSRRKRMGDEIAGNGGDADRRQAGRRIAADHEFEGIEGAGQRRAERARDRRRGAAADHDALVGAAQMKAAADARRRGRWRAGCSRPQARPRRRRRSTRSSAPRRSRCRETTSARHAAHWPRSDRFPGSDDGSQSPAPRSRARCRPASARGAPVPDRAT